MAKVQRSVNYTKLVHEAQRTKSRVKKSQIAAYENWQKRLGSKSGKLDKLEKRFRDILKQIADAHKAKEDDRKAIDRLARMLEGAYSELETFKQVPVKEKLPPYPKNIVALNSIVVVVLGAIAYTAAVKAYMAMCEALADK